MNSEWQSDASVDRRGFILGASAALVAAGIPAEARAGGEDNETFVGRLDAVLGPAEAKVTIARDGVQRRVRLAAGAYVLHGLGGATRDLSSFVPGEQVVLRAAERGAIWQATEFESLFTNVTGRVISLSDDRVETDAGTLMYAPPVMARPRTFARNTRFVASVWTDPSSGRRYANALLPEG